MVVDIRQNELQKRGESRVGDDQAAVQSKGLWVNVTTCQSASHEN